MEPESTHLNMRKILSSACVETTRCSGLYLNRPREKEADPSVQVLAHTSSLAFRLGDWTPTHLLIVLEPDSHLFKPSGDGEQVYPIMRAKSLRAKHGPVVRHFDWRVLRRHEPINIPNGRQHSSIQVAVYG